MFSDKDIITFSNISAKESELIDSRFKISKPFI